MEGKEIESSQKKDGESGGWQRKREREEDDDLELATSFLASNLHITPITRYFGSWCSEREWVFSGRKNYEFKTNES